MIIPKTEAAGAGNPALENAEQSDMPSKPVPGPSSVAETKPKSGGRLYIPWYELLRRTFGEEAGCPDCGGRLRLIALVIKEETIQTLLKAMHLPTQATGPPERVKSEPAEPEALEFKWSREGESAEGKVGYWRKTGFDLPMHSSPGVTNRRPWERGPMDPGAITMRNLISL